MDLKTQRRLASSILKVGEGRVWFDPEETEALTGAVTRRDVARLVEDGVVRVKPQVGVSRYRAKARSAQKAKGRQKGPGKRSGTKGARSPKKRRWIAVIRPLRQRLSEMKEAGEIDNATYKRLYYMAKGGAFKSKAHLEMKGKTTPG